VEDGFLKGFHLMPTVLEIAPEATTAKASLLEIAINRDALFAELSFAQSIAQSKTTLPILSTVLLVGSENAVTITATDLERSIVTSLSSRAKKTGTVAISGRKLYDYIKLLPNGSEVSVKVLDNSWVQLRCGRSNTKMVAMPPANFPKVETIGNRISLRLPVTPMKQLLAQTGFAISREESRYTLNGALFGLEPERLCMVATDGHRMSISEKRVQISGVVEKFSVLVPKRAIEDLQNLLSVTEETEIGFAKDDNNLYFVVGHRQYTSRRLTGAFPNYEAVIPVANNKSFVVSVAEVERAARRVATFADERSGAIKLNLSDNMLRFSAHSVENGESEDSIETTYSQEPVAIGFNSAYILDFLKAIGSKGEVRIAFKDGTSSALLRPEGGDQETDLKYVMMPMRT
jgi:DNA polymerase-3 subunit beta